jgi:hypothetical protein
VAYSGPTSEQQIAYATAQREVFVALLDSVQTPLRLVAAPSYASSFSNSTAVAGTSDPVDLTVALPSGVAIAPDLGITYGIDSPVRGYYGGVLSHADGITDGGHSGWNLKIGLLANGETWVSGETYPVTIKVYNGGLTYMKHFNITVP